MVFFVVLLVNGELVAIKEEWILKTSKSKVKVFYGPDQNATADFSVETKYFFKNNEIACYEADICKRFESMDEAENHIRKVHKSTLLQLNRNTFRSNERRTKNSERPVVECYELSDSDQENVDPDMQNAFEDVALNQVVSSNQITSSSSIKEPSEFINIRCKKTASCTSSTETAFESIELRSVPTVESGSNIGTKRQTRSSNNVVMPQRCIGFDLAAIERMNKKAAKTSSLSDGDLSEPDVDYKNKVIKLEKTVEILSATNAYLNKRIGADIIDDSDSSSLSDIGELLEPVENNRHQQYDFQFASLYSFTTNSRGDRLYFEGDLKLKGKIVERLKLMTANYPENTSDYDEIFLYRAMKALFTNKNIQNLAKSQSLFDLKQPKRQFLRDLFSERVGSDPTRLAAFRSKLLSAAKRP